MTERKFHNGVWDKHSVFVFGSNEGGRHGKGAAKFALQNCGARYGYGCGHHGNSYAIPTKDVNIKTLPLDEILGYVESFLWYTTNIDNSDYFITAIGTGLAGYSHKDIAPMFKNAPENCILPIEWKEFVCPTF